MRTAMALFDEFGAAMQFPDYFGENWPALDECLSDLSWMPGKAYAVVVTRAEQVLREEPIEMLGLLADLFVKVASNWAVSVRKGETWDRPEVPFHFVLQVAPEHNDEFSSRSAALGVEIGDITRSKMNRAVSICPSNHRWAVPATSLGGGSLTP